ncbi:MAG TPA: GNAT family N-acetyltransferase [Aggregatilineaceae bacterium]|nr:GNAT family N-acetyltransferase [Anaerolineae bacterium]HMM27460.1 GNAT family N-acetyltransferase [Aggregatilineaceae bacterium]
MSSELSPLLNRVVFRPIALDDADGLNATCWSDRPRDVVIDLLRRAQRLAEQRRGLAVTALRENQPCAFAMLTLWPHCAEISDLIVSEPLRGHRIGTGLIEYLAQAARGLGATMLEIGAALSNPRAIELYRRLGFRDGRVVTLDLASGPEPVLYLYRAVSSPDYCQPVGSPR